MHLIHETSGSDDSPTQSPTVLDLVFYFVDELLPDQMPETVHLMPQGKIRMLSFDHQKKENLLLL
jgi:hypothetical protein